ncbi:xanthine dehydrogenase family protein molybdopterin-binding subunit [Treponema sp. R6D11]
MESLTFLEDIYPPNVLYAITIRSPMAKGNFKNIYVPELPENYTLITAKNIPGENRLEGTNIPILADKTLNYIGEPVAIILGADKTKLEEISARCEILADEEDAVFVCNNSDEPILTREINTGDTLESFQETGKIVTGSYKTGIQEHWYAEPIGAISWINKEKEIKRLKNVKHDPVIIRTATQWPYHVKRSVARALNIDLSYVAVEPTALNLHMDGKLWYPSLIACHAALGTHITKKAVRLILTREEDFLYTPKRFSANINIASAINDNGNTNAANIDISVNLGAYEVNGNEILDQVCLGVIGLYNFPNLSLKARAYCTNIPPQGAFSGFGLAQGIFAMERHVSLIADMANQDPAELRENNIDPQIMQSQTKQKNNIHSKKLISSTIKTSDYNHKWASYELLRKSRKGKKQEKGENPRGIGIAVGFQGNGLLYTGEDNGSYSVEVTLTKEGVLEIKTSITSMEDYTKIWGKVALETMSIEPDMVRIIASNAPDCGPSCASRNITAVTKLVEKCCLSIRKQRFHDPLPITVRRSIKPQNGTLLGGRFMPPEGKNFDINSFSKLGLACAVVEVSIDLVECIPVIRGIWLGIDGGKLISEHRAKRNLTRAAVQALGWAYTENIEYVDGIIPSDQYNNFTIFSPVEIPPIHIDFFSEDTTEPKGVSDLPFTCIPAAFLQAVSQAMDHSFKTIPLKRKDIWEILRARNLDTDAQGAK